MSQLSLDNITRSFSGEPSAVDQLSLSIERGEFVVLFGPSGCGKTTTLRLIAGLEAPDTGDITIDGQSILKQSPAQRRVAMVMQDQSLYPHLTVQQNLAFGRSMSRKSKSDLQTKIKHAAELLEISHMLERKPTTLSGGERQRVAIGRAIVRDPFCFLFDEPLSHLDIPQRYRLRNAIHRLQQTLGRAMIYVTHDLREAMMLADRLVVMKGGKALQIAQPTEVFDRPANLAVANVISDPPMNVLHTSDLVGSDSTHLPQVIAQRSCLIGIRPRDLCVSHPSSNDKKTIQFSGTVAHVRSLGNVMAVTIKLKGSTVELQSELSYDCNVAEGDNILMDCRTQDLHCFDQALPHHRIDIN